jgi:hypothetical protein
MLAVGTLFFMNRPAIAWSCPWCFGFRSVGSDVYADGQLPLFASQTLAMAQAARHQVEAFFDNQIPRASILICTTETCYRRAEGRGGVSKAVSWSDKVLIVSPRGINVTIMAHELTHVEFRHLLGTVAYARVPSWFDEGLAVYVADDRRYLAPAGAKDRCLVSGSDTLPISNAGWWDVMSHKPTRAYALAACRVSRWMGQERGRDGLIDLIRKMRAGQDFGSAFSRADN